LTVSSALLPCDQWPKPFLCFVGVVRGTPELEVRRIGCAAIGEWDDVVELEESALDTAPHCADEGAAPSVAGPDLPLHGCRHMTGPWLLRNRAPRTFRHCHPCPLETLHQQCQRTLEDDRGIPVGDCMPQEVLRTTQCRVCFAGDRDLHFVSLGRERRKDDAISEWYRRWCGRWEWRYSRRAASSSAARWLTGISLVDQTMVNDFRPFGAAMAKLSTSSKVIERDDGIRFDLPIAIDKKQRIDTSYEIYLALYQ